MKKPFLLAAGVVIIIAIVLFHFYKKPAQNTQVIKIGTTYALSGAAAYWGVDELRGAEIAVDEANASGGINGSQIQLVSEDVPAIDGLAKAVSAVQKLVSVDKVNAILGPTWDDNSQAVAPLADQLQVVMVSSAASSAAEKDKDYKFFFSTSLPEKAETDRMAEYAKEKGYTKVAILRTNDPFSSLYTQKFTEGAQALGLSVLKDIAISDLAPKDFRTYITTLKTLKVDAVYAVLDDEASRCPFLQQAKELGFTKPILSTLSTESPDSLKNCGSFLEQDTYTYQKQGPAYDALLKKYEVKYNAEPTGPALAEAYDAAQILITQMRAGNLSGSALQQGIENTKNFSGATGDGISFNAIGHFDLPATDFVIKTVRNGKFVIVE